MRRSEKDLTEEFDLMIEYLDQETRERDRLNESITDLEKRLEYLHDAIMQVRADNEQCIGCGKYVDTAYTPEGIRICSDCYAAYGPNAAYSSFRLHQCAWLSTSEER
jgi:hypothetical protein